MNWKLWRDLTLIIGGFLLIWWVAIKLDLGFMETAPLVTPEREEELADLLLDEVLQEFDFVEEPTIDSAIGVILDRLLANQDSLNYSYRIRIIENSQVNAFTTLGGNIFIYTGLLRYVESPEELAVIIAHEIGHAENQHVLNKLAKQLGMEIVFSILTGGDPVLVSEISKIAVSTSFDRKMEREADQYAMELALKSKINPRRMGQFFIRSLESNSVIGEELQFLMTHPHAKNRIESVLEFEVPEDFGERRFDIEWPLIQEAI